MRFLPRIATTPKRSGQCSNMSDSRVAELEAEVASLKRELDLLRGKSQPSIVEAKIPSPIPAWIEALRRDPAQRRVRLREWEDMTWRKENGWLGRDLCHNPDGQAVRVLEYYWDSSRAMLTGIVWFGPLCESHRGLCHGGSYTSLLDDVTGHYAFLCSEPWHGATVQVNVSLKKPIRIGQILRVVAYAEPSSESQAQQIDTAKSLPTSEVNPEANATSSDRKRKRSSRKKISVMATIDGGSGDDGDVYAKLEGLSVGGVRIVAEDGHKSDAIAKRGWVSSDVDGESVYMDTGWSL